MYFWWCPALGFKARVDPLLSHQCAVRETSCTVSRHTIYVDPAVRRGVQNSPYPVPNTFACYFNEGGSLLWQLFWVPKLTKFPYLIFTEGSGVEGRLRVLIPTFGPVSRTYSSPQSHWFGGGEWVGDCLYSPQPKFVWPNTKCRPPPPKYSTWTGPHHV